MNHKMRIKKKIESLLKPTKNKWKIWEFIWTGVIISIVNVFLYLLVSSLLLNKNYSFKEWLIILIFFAVMGAFIGLISIFLINIKKIRFDILLTLCFLSTVLLGFLGIPPFGVWDTIGDVLSPIPTPIVIFPLLPLIFIMLILKQGGLDIFWRGFSFEAIFLILVVLGYYYFLSKFIVYIWFRLKRGKRNE